MDPGLALSGVEYTIQLAQHIKYTVKAYQQNPAQYENLISRFRTVQKSLRIIASSKNVDFQSPIWGRAFRRIRDEFEETASTLKEIHRAIQSSPLQRLFHAKETSRKLGDVEIKIDALQRDLDLLGFFTFSNAASAHHFQVLNHNVQDVTASLLALEARLQAIEQKLQAQNSEKPDGDRLLPSKESLGNQDSQCGLLQEGEAEYKEKVKELYQRQLEKPRQRRKIMEHISILQTRLKNRAAAAIQTQASEDKSTLLSEVCEGLLSQWSLDHTDVHFLPSNQKHFTERSVVYEGSMTIRGLWKYPIREAKVAVKLIFEVEGKTRLDALLRRFVALREIDHPNIVSFYGVCWPMREDYKKSKVYEQRWSMKYALLVTELMTHNLAEAIKLPTLSNTDTKLMILANVSRGVEYLHRRGIFRIALTSKHVMLRIVQGEVVGQAKLSSLWSSCEDMRKNEESLFKSKEELQSRAPIFHQDTFNFGILMCFVLSSRVDRSSWDDSVFTRIPSKSKVEGVLELARVWVRGIEPPFLKELAKRCIFNEKGSRPSFKFIRACIEAFLKNSPLPDLSTPDCGETIRKEGKDIFYGKEGNLISPEKAIAYFERAASCGNVSALVNLGNCHFYGLGTQRDVKRGFELFRAAAFAGHAAGLVKLGICYHSGTHGVVSTDIVLAVELYRRAAIQGSVSAQFKLGCYKYNEEVGSPRHLQEGAALWELAAHGGHRFAQFFVGRCFEEGKGMPQDIEAARIWYGRSAAQGSFGGKWALQRLSNADNVDPSNKKSEEPEII